MEIVHYPDPRLRAKNAPIETFDNELGTTVRQMFDAMYASEGVGLAAPQVGLNIRLLVFNPEGDQESPETERVCCNPKVISRSRENDLYEEGCLSFPDIRAQINRPLSIVVEAQDLQGMVFRWDLDDFSARVFQHEFDHLDGLLFIDRMTPADRTQVKGVLSDMEEEFRQRAQV